MPFIIPLPLISSLLPFMSNPYLHSLTLYVAPPGFLSSTIPVIFPIPVPIPALAPVKVKVSAPVPVLLNSVLSERPAVCCSQAVNAFVVAVVVSVKEDVVKEADVKEVVVKEAVMKEVVVKELIAVKAVVSINHLRVCRVRHQVRH
jgi:hypothetical protein